MRNVQFRYPSVALIRRLLKLSIDRRVFPPSLKKITTTRNQNRDADTSVAILGPFQTSNFTCAESNAIEKNLLFSLICIRFGTCKVRRLKRATLYFLTKTNVFQLAKTK